MSGGNDRYESLRWGTGASKPGAETVPAEVRWIDPATGEQWVVYNNGGTNEWVKLTGGEFAPSPHDGDHHTGVQAAGDIGQSLPNANTFPTGTNWLVRRIPGIEIDGSTVMAVALNCYANGQAPTENISIVIKHKGVLMGTITIAADQQSGSVDLSGAPVTIDNDSYFTIDMPEDVKEAKGFEWRVSLVRDWT